MLTALTTLMSGAKGLINLTQAVAGANADVNVAANTREPLQVIADQ